MNLALSWASSPQFPVEGVDHSADSQEKAQLGMEFRNALGGSRGASKCLPVEPAAAGLIPQLSFSLATWMAGCGELGCTALWARMGGEWR